MNKAERERRPKPYARAPERPWEFDDPTAPPAWLPWPFPAHTRPDVVYENLGDAEIVLEVEASELVSKIEETFGVRQPRPETACLGGGGCTPLDAPPLGARRGGPPLCFCPTRCAIGRERVGAPS